MKTKFSKYLIPVVLFMFLSACDHGHVTSDNHAENKTEIIIDTDMGLDDVRTLMAILADTTLEVTGILTVDGSAAVGKATDNLIGLLEENDILSGPVVQ